MWFESDKMYYEAIVKSHLHDSTYNIMWVKEAAEEPMELKESDNTEDPANEDRWSVVTEPVYRVISFITYEVILHSFCTICDMMRYWWHQMILISRIPVHLLLLLSSRFLPLFFKVL